MTLLAIIAAFVVGFYVGLTTLAMAKTAKRTDDAQGRHE